MKKFYAIIFLLASCLLQAQERLVFEDAVEQFKAGNYKRAEERFSQVIVENKFEKNAYLNRGNARFKLEKYREAVEDYTTFLETIPNYDKPYEIIPEASYAFYLRGLAHAALNNYKDAVSDFRRSVETNPPGLPALFELANIKFDNKDYEGAIENLTTYIDFVPTSVEAYNNRGLARAKLGRSLKAIDDFTAAIAIDSTNPDLYYNRAFEKFMLRRNREALEDFSKAMQRKPDYLNALYYRGKIYYSLGDYENAKADLQKATRLKPDDVRVKDALFAANLTHYFSKYWLYLLLIVAFAVTAIVLLVKVLKTKNENLADAGEL